MFDLFLMSLLTFSMLVLLVVGVALLFVVIGG